MPKKLTIELVKVLITVSPETAAELKQRAKDRSKPGAKVSQGDIVTELLKGYVVEPEERSTFRQSPKVVKETTYIEVPELVMPDWRRGRQPLLKPSDPNRKKSG